MNKTVGKIVATALGAVLLAGGLFGCGGQSPSTAGTSGATGTTAAASGPINVISREDGSGTRSAFVELFEVRTEDSKGKKVDATTTSAVITNSTSVMLTTVEGDKNAIGYVSLGSLSTTVKALDIDGVHASADNVKSGTYKISRPFNIVTNGSASAAAEDFINFIMSKDGQKVIEDDHYIAVAPEALAYKGNGATGTVVVAGSSSVTPVMEKLKEAYATANSGVKVEIQQSDSSTGIQSTIDGICDIGMASRELKDSEASQGLTPKTIAIDGIAVIVNKNNPLSTLTREQVAEIFLGKLTEWQAL